MIPTSAPCKTKPESTRLQTHTAKINGITAEATRIDVRKARWPKRERVGKTMAKTVNSAKNPPIQALTQCICLEFTMGRILAQCRSVALEVSGGWCRQRPKKEWLGPLLGKDPRPSPGFILAELPATCLSARLRAGCFRLIAIATRSGTSVRTRS